MKLIVDASGHCSASESGVMDCDPSTVRSSPRVRDSNVPGVKEGLIYQVFGGA